MLTSRRLFSSLVLLLAFTLTVSAFAQPVAVTKVEEMPPRLEISALSNGAFFFNGDGSFGFVAVGASYALLPGLQLGATVGYARASVSVDSDDSSAWVLGALFGPTLNFPFDLDLRNAFFVSGKYGIGTVGGTYVSDTGDNSEGMLDFTIGKRFKIFDCLSFVPEFGMSKVLSDSDTDALYRFVPLSFSLFF